MIQRIRSHLTYANVMVTILAFVVLGGGTALASYVVSSNSQVGPGTVSGHKPPSGKHSNLIAGSVNGQDVAANSLTGANVKESSLTGTAQGLIYDSAGNGLRRKIATVGPYTLKGECDKKIAGAVFFHVYVNGPAGGFNLMDSVTENDNGVDLRPDSRGGFIPANTDVDAVAAGADHGDFERLDGTAFLQTGSKLVQVDFDMIADGRYGDCLFRGTSTVAT